MFLVGPDRGDEVGPFVYTGCCSQVISRMFSEVAHMYPAY